MPLHTLRMLAAGVDRNRNREQAWIQALSRAGYCVVAWPVIDRFAVLEECCTLPDALNDSVAKARALAHRAHYLQLDKAGRPCIEHVARVAAAVRGDDIAEAVAWLHDVLEDCPGYEALVYEFDGRIVDAVLRLTYRPNVTRIDYYTAIRQSAIALKVKLADIEDNCREARLAILDEYTQGRLRQKYQKAREMLA